MKTFTAKTLLLFCTTLFLFACAKDDDPTPTPVPTPKPDKHSVAQVLEGNYWQEKICFIYADDGFESDIIKVTGDITHEFSTEGGVMLNKRLNRFHVDSEAGKIHAFDYENTYIGNWYYQNKFSFEYPSKNYIRIHTNDEQCAHYGAAFNIDLQVIKCTDKEVILDGPIKPYIWQNWNLDGKSEYMGIMYLGIRVYWTKIENGAELFEPSSPLD